MTAPKIVEKKKKRFEMLMTKSMAKRIKEYAKREGISMAAVIERGLNMLFSEE